MLKFTLRTLRKIHHILTLQKQETSSVQYEQFTGYVELYNQNANDYIRNLLSNEKPCMISKFGTTELFLLTSHLETLQEKYTLADYWDFITEKRSTLWWPVKLTPQIMESGFFPNDSRLLVRFYDEYLPAIKNVDVLGSYMEAESKFADCLKEAKRVNLDGYYAPFYYKNPWTKVLKGKRVLVVHPFADDIERQYAKRKKLWQDPDVLPDFELITYKSVQSMFGVCKEFSSWFEALDKMKNDISQLDFDIAIVGCGAYGMPLASHIKNMGKQVIHLAGWTQVLFGIYGTRWLDNPRLRPFINKSWIRPSKSNKPRNAEKVENGCYW
jgi:hypothetical protein